MSGSGRKTLQDVRKWSGGPPKCPGVVGRSSRMSLSGERPSRMSGRVGRPLGCPGVVRRTSQISGSGREACLMSGSGREAPPDIW